MPQLYFAVFMWTKQSESDPEYEVYVPYLINDTENPETNRIANPDDARKYVLEKVALALRNHQSAEYLALQDAVIGVEEHIDFSVFVRHAIFER